MTRTGYARLAGFMFLFYIANGITVMILSNRVTGGGDVAAMLASIAQHAALMRWTIVLTLLTGVDALVLGVALYALTRDYDHDLAMLALCFRVAEGVLGAAAAIHSATLLAFAMRSGVTAADAAGTNAVGSLLLHGAGSAINATLFAFGSTIFCYIFLRARTIPAALAWLGVISSVLLAIALPLQLGGVIQGALTNYIWIPMALFEVTFAFWLLIKGVRPATAAA